MNVLFLLLLRCVDDQQSTTTDVTTLLTVVERLKQRFNINRVCIVADRGMISAKTIAALEDPDNRTPYILGVRMRKVKRVADQVLSHPGSYRHVRPEGSDPQKPSPL